MQSMLRLRWLGLSLALLFVVATAASAAGSPGFLTSQPSMLTPKAAGSSVLPIITVGDTLPESGYTFLSIPDGIGLTLKGKGAVDVFVSHETSLVPFPFNPVTGVGQSDFDNAQVSKLRLSRGTARLLEGWVVIDSSANYQRFCSAFLADKEHGFERPIFFANEEATDFISPPPLVAWPPDPGNQRQAGLVVALDTRTGQTYEIPGLGRMNHENTIVVPGGWDDVVVVTDDDTFSAPAAQFYMYLAASPDDLLADKGNLYAFQVTGTDEGPVNPADPFNGANDYGDITEGDNWTGRFIPVPRAIALGDQTPLENWSNDNNVFQFIRTEDIAYDKNNPRIIYIADTGEPRATPNPPVTVPPTPPTGRLFRGSSSTVGPYPNGRIFRMVLNALDPKVVDSFTILIDADAGGYNNPNVLHNPDNIDTSANSLMIQEDPGSHNSTRSLFPNATTARVWRYDLTMGMGTLSVVAEVDQSLVPASPKGAWESSGIVNASPAFGPGTWLVTVQAHTLFVETEQRGPLLFKREGGQLLLLTVPGS